MTKAPVRSDAPLAARMRPATVEEYLGQRHVVGEGALLRRALDHGQLPSLILWGPPGTGKTSLAMLIAGAGGAAFESVSAVSAGVADLRAAVARARERLRSGRPTILFIDEIHRFTKTQQDAILPHVEDGSIRLLGATTENPSHQINGALLSRARVVRLEPLGAQDLRALVLRALTDSDRGLGRSSDGLEERALELLIEAAGGDARVALNALELAVQTHGDRREPVTAAEIAEALQAPSLLFDRAGDQHYWVASAFIKSIRGSDADAAIYWLARLLEAGEDPRFVGRRLVIAAGEDIGLADPEALRLAVASLQAVELLGMPEGMYPLAEATLYLARAPKSNAVGRAYQAAREAVEQHRALPVPLHLRNSTSATDRAQGFGAGYRYSHDEPPGAAAQQFLPEALAGRRFVDAPRTGA